MPKTGLLDSSLVGHLQSVPMLKNVQHILLTFRTKSKCTTKFFKVLRDLAPVIFSNNNTQHSSPLTPFSVILTFFQSLNTPYFLLTLGLCSCCSVPTTSLNRPSLPSPRTWPILTGPSNLNSGILSSRKPPLTPAHLLGVPLLDPVAHHSFAHAVL